MHHMLGLVTIFLSITLTSVDESINNSIIGCYECDGDKYFVVIVCVFVCAHVWK